MKSHENIIKYFDFYFWEIDMEDEYVSLKMEYVSTDLDKLIETGEKLDEMTCRTMLL